MDWGPLSAAAVSVLIVVWHCWALRTGQIEYRRFPREQFMLEEIDKRLEELKKVLRESNEES